MFEHKPAQTCHQISAGQKPEMDTSSVDRQPHKLPDSSLDARATAWLAAEVLKHWASVSAAEFIVS